MKPMVLLFYETYGAEEYYSYDPDRLRLKGWIRQGSELVAIPEMDGWVSPRMGIRFTLTNRDLKIYRPDGRKFMSSVELEETARQARIQEQQARQSLIQEQQRSQSQLDQIVVNLLRSGMASQQIADIAGCSIDYVESLQS